MTIAQAKKFYEQDSKKYDISSGMVRSWVIKYREFGGEGLVNKRKPGNPMSKYFVTKYNKVSIFLKT